jgi:hypothetical protein
MNYSRIWRIVLSVFAGVVDGERVVGLLGCFELDFVEGLRRC